MKNKKLLCLIPVLIIASFFLFSNYSLAQGGIIPAPSGGNEGRYTLNDFMLTGIKVSDLILGLVGSLSLLMFVVGGVLFMISGGSSEKVSKAKNILVASVVGLLIVFSSYLIIKFTLSSIGAKNEFDGEIKVPAKTSLHTPYQNLKYL